jgi:FkbH-like protein
MMKRLSQLYEKQIETIINDDVYRCPPDFVVTKTSLRRIIAIGSCLMEGWPHVIQNADPGCPCDYFIFNNIGQLPDTPPRPIDNYDFQVVQIPLRSVIPDYLYFQLRYADLEAYQRLYSEARTRLSQFLAAAMQWNSKHGLLTFVLNFLVPQQNPMGRLLPRYDLRNMVYFIEKLNEALDEELRSYSNAYLFDQDQMVATYGRRNFQDDAIWTLNHNATLSDWDFPHDGGRLETIGPASAYYPSGISEYIQLAWLELISMYRTVRQIDSVKLVIIDLDDTLWRGVAAERGQNEGTIPELIEGWPLGFAEALNYLRRRGVLLAIISKNDESRVTNFWNHYLGGRLRLDDFVARKINWRPKAENFEEILQEVNLLPRNVVYIDDNPIERAAIKAAFSDVRVLGPNPLVWRRIVLWSAETQVAAITPESAVRTEMVRAQIARETQRWQLSRDDFLASLEVELTTARIESDAHPHFARTIELINKTNQFNTTGKRWTREEFVAAFASGTEVYTFAVKDRFTSYGVVALAVIRRNTIDQLVMSCRVVGLDVEIAIVAEILRIMNARRVDAAEAILKATELNLLCRDLYRRCGFDEDGERWHRPLPAMLQVPSHIRVTRP